MPARLAEQVLQSIPGPLFLPVDIESIIARYGVKLVKEPFSPAFTGAYFPLSRPVIVINNRMPETRQRFTMAHELCHHLDHLQAPVQIARFYSNDKSFIERRANRFAAEVLMPKAIVKALRSLGYTDAGMAKVCKISKDVAIKRLKELKVV